MDQPRQGYTCAWEHNRCDVVPALYSSGTWDCIHAWTLGPVELLSAVLALTTGLWVYALAAKEKLSSPALILNGALYLLFIVVVLRG